MKKKRLLITLLIAIIAAAGWFGYSQTHETAAQKLTTVTIGYQKADPVDISRARGELAKKMKKQGYQVVFKEFQDGTALTTALKAGDIDYARLGDVPPVTAQANGMDFVYIAAGADKVKGSGIEVKKNSQIASVADLKGKTIAYTKGTSAQFMIIQALKKAGLTTSDVKLVSMDQSAAAVAFAKGTVDAWATWDPYTSTAEVNANAKLLVDDTGLAKNRDFLISSKQYAAKHQQVSKLLVQYLADDMDWANTHKTALTDMLVKMLKLKKSIVLRMVQRRDYSMGKVTTSILKEQQTIADVFYAQGLISKKVNVESATLQ
ncbi:aliphatic sulfonate ABC transporter substrate-binding protein [Lacticaseibacillus baoqingensis]|uniref:Aliphatic sulfonate ABC transporter substrate-binding protein n=1 Tax=Lacticaseibacillus baoqingensis TaxID=2486013 RepID=A0ABW4E9Z3_9LACO|nr:aliphatic sulfonate ABC transporter substrate-binding protein [Lacticaseibacillus baoqingensis]